MAESGPTADLDAGASTNGAGALRPAGSSPHRPATAANVVQDVLKWAEAVAVPIGAVSGLLLFFGSTFSSAYFGYFGVDQQLLQYSVQDQVLLSADVLFGTGILALAVVGSVVLVDQLLVRDHAPKRGRRWRKQRERLLHLSRAGFPLIGAGFLVVGLESALRLPQLPAIVPLRLAAVLFLLGAVVLLRVGLRTGRRAGRTVLVAALVLATFWITTLYAENEGLVLARQIDDTPAHLPLVTLYTTEYLDLPGPSVLLSPQTSPTGAPLYRYGGLRLLAFSNNRWFLLTGRYDGYRSTVAIVENDKDVRAEVAQQSE